MIGRNAERKSNETQRKYKLVSQKYDDTNKQIGHEKIIRFQVRENRGTMEGE